MPKSFVPRQTLREKMLNKMRIAKEAVNHPDHYGGAGNPYETIKVIEAWGLGFHDGNAVKYIARAGKKDPSKLLEDLEKARWYLDRLIANLRKDRPESNMMGRVTKDTIILRG